MSKPYGLMQKKTSSIYWNQFLQISRSNLCSLRMASNGNLAVLGVSGGLDSAVSLGVLRCFFKPEQIKCIHFHDKLSSPPPQQLLELEQWAKVKIQVRDISSIYEQAGVYDMLVPYGILCAEQLSSVISNYRASGDLATMFYSSGPLWDGGPTRELLTAYGAFRLRLRTALLYNIAEANSGFVVSNANRSETTISFGVMHGDLAGHFFPLCDLLKSDVLKLAKVLDVPESIRQAKPSAGIFLDVTDEEVLGFSYTQLDTVIRGLDQALSIVCACELAGLDLEQTQRIAELLNRSGLVSLEDKQNLANSDLSTDDISIGDVRRAELESILGESRLFQDSHNKTINMALILLLGSASWLVSGFLEGKYDFSNLQTHSFAIGSMCFIPAMVVTGLMLYASTTTNTVFAIADYVNRLCAARQKAPRVGAWSTVVDEYRSLRIGEMTTTIIWFCLALTLIGVACTTGWQLLLDQGIWGYIIASAGSILSCGGAGMAVWLMLRVRK